MTRYALPALFALLVWWFSTGLVLYWVGKPRQTYPATFAAATLILILALIGVSQSSTDTSLTGAYIAFASALAIWGWHEVSFLTGMITGPRITPLEKDARGLRRFLAASATLIHHELAIALSIPVIMLLVGDGQNRVALLSFLVLWLARLSTKLNVFLGVPNLTEQFLPDHLDYLKSYFRRRSMNALFPLTVTAATMVTVKLAENAIAAPTAASAAGLSLVAALAALAVLEHWFLVVPLPSAKLWDWGMRSREPAASTAANQDEITSTRPPQSAPRKAIGALA